MAASKLRIVSKGRSQRLRVGFERSGSATVMVSGRNVTVGMATYQWGCPDGPCAGCYAAEPGTFCVSQRPRLVDGISKDDQGMGCGRLTWFRLVHGHTWIGLGVQSLGLLLRRRLVEVELVGPVRLVGPEAEGSRLTSLGDRSLRHRRVLSWRCLSRGRELVRRSVLLLLLLRRRLLLLLLLLILARLLLLLLVLLRTVLSSRRGERREVVGGRHVGGRTRQAQYFYCGLVEFSFWLGAVKDRGGPWRESVLLLLPMR